MVSVYFFGIFQYLQQISGLHLIVILESKERHTFMDNILLRAYFKLKHFLKHKQCVSA